MLYLGNELLFSLLLNWYSIYENYNCVCLCMIMINLTQAKNQKKMCGLQFSSSLIESFIHSSAVCLHILISWLYLLTSSFFFSSSTGMHLGGRYNRAARAGQRAGRGKKFREIEFHELFSPGIIWGHTFST